MRWTSERFDFGGFGVEVAVEDEAQERAVRAEISTFARSSNALGPCVLWQSSGLDLGSVELSGEPGRRQYGRHSDGLVVRHRAVTGIVSSTSITLGGTSADHADLLDDYRTVFGSVMTHWLSYQRHFPIHGAAVSRNRQALLLLGSPGAGKSTAAWGAHLRGFDLLGDDTVFLRPRDGYLELSGMRKPIALASEILNEIPIDATQDQFRGEGGGSRDRWALQPDMLTPGWHRVIGVVTPTHGTDADGGLTEAERVSLLPLAVGAYYASDNQTQLRAWFPHAAAIARLPAWKLHHSPDSARRLDAAAHWLSVAFDEATSGSDAD